MTISNENKSTVKKFWQIEVSYDPKDSLWEDREWEATGGEIDDLDEAKKRLKYAQKNLSRFNYTINAVRLVYVTRIATEVDD